MTTGGEDPVQVDRLDQDRRDGVPARLGFAAEPAADLEGLAALYLAWCRGVPFDNVRKLISLADAAANPSASPTALAGGTAEDFFAAWLAHGTGGTCWPSANALHALLVSCGFVSRRIAASMGETGEPSHGSTVVTIDDHEYLLDTSMLTNVPVPLDRRVDTATVHPVFATTVEVVPEGWRFVFPLANAAATLPCRTLSPDAVELAFFLERYEASRAWSPFNVHVNTRQNVVGVDGGAAIISYADGRRFERRAEGIVATDLRGESLRAALVEELSMSEEIVASLFRSYDPPPSPPRPPPPSTDDADELSA